MRKIETANGHAAMVEQMECDLSAIRRALRRPLEAEVAKGGLTAPQTAVMQATVKADGISLKELSAAVSLAHSTVSGIVDRLEKRGLLTRRADTQDGRISRVYPTAAVTSFLREQMSVLARGPLKAAMGRANQSERNEISRSLHRLRELLEEG
jgi:DNA-binding MarR family transcriptional regulator